MLLITVAQFVGHELLLFAAIGLLLCGVDDIIIDVAWLVRGLWRHLVIRRRYPAATVATLASGTSGRLAVFVPAWDESGIIATMVGNALNSIKDSNYRIYVAGQKLGPKTSALPAFQPSQRGVLGPEGAIACSMQQAIRAA